MKMSNTLDKGDDIAVVAMTGRFPQATNVGELWQNLRDGVEAITFFSDEELLAAGVEQAVLRHPQYVKAAAMLEDVELFDASFFGYQPGEAETIDPQHRLFLECAWEVLEQAGYDTEHYKGLVGVYAGVGANRYLWNLLGNQQIVKAGAGHNLALGNDKDHLCMRLAYKLNLKGPSVSVQTACSTSLVAVHLACQGLLNGECDIALAGGVSVRIPQKIGYQYFDGGITSPDGHCRSFDSQAHGTIGGSGVGIVVLKRLEDALADGDTIHALIKGSAINNDGAARVGYTAPSIDGQTEVIAQALQVAAVNPETITYVETHGTATPLGDTIEISALTQAYRAHTEKRGYCAIGSVKTNLGHLDAAAGVTGLIKTVLALKHRMVPPSLHFETPNPIIDFASSPFFVNTRLTEWRSDAAPRRAGVSAFGIGGTNAHVIVEEAPAPEPTDPSREWQLLTLSAKTSAALNRMTHNLAAYLKRHPDINLADAAYTLKVGRRAFEHRRMLLCRNVEETVAALESADAGSLLTSHTPTKNRSVAFIFPGQSSASLETGRGLYQAEPAFRERVDECAELLLPHLGFDLRLILYPADGETPQARTQTAQVRLNQTALFVLEYALARMWKRWGVRPTALAGQGVGEYVAACLAGVLSLPDALRLVAVREQLMQSAPDSQLTEAMLAAFTSELRKVRLNAPRIPCVSSVTGKWMTAVEATDSNYWLKHLRQPTLFDEVLNELLKDEQRVLLEVGSQQSLCSLVEHHRNASKQQVTIASLAEQQQGATDVEHALKALGQLWLSGINIDWPNFYAHEQRRRVALPTYPFERERYWVEPDSRVDTTQGRRAALRKSTDISRWFYTPSWKRSGVPVARQGNVAPVSDSCCLLFLDEFGVGAQMAERLERAGRNVLTVRRGRQFIKHHERSFSINTSSAEDYDALLVELQEMHDRLDCVVHLWNVGDDRDEQAHDASVQDLETGFSSLLRLAQSLDKHNFTRPLQLNVVTTGTRDVTGKEILVPAKATTLAPCRVIPQEYPHITCRSIDINLPPDDTLEQSELVKQLVSEVQAATPDTVVAYRGAYRWVQTFEPLPLEAVTETPSPLREGGTYLITGGLDNVGLALAEHLARAARARIVLTSLSEFPAQGEWERSLQQLGEAHEVSRKIRRLQSLEALGAEVLVAQADVTDQAQIRRLLTHIAERCGRLHGVIHTAGASGERLHREIQESSGSECEQQLLAKLRGVSALAEALRGYRLDFCALMSSLSAIVGGRGAVGDAAAAIFMDVFAQQQSRNNGAAWMTIDWDEGSFEESEAETNDGMPATLEMAMLPHEAREAFSRALTAGHAAPQIVISTCDLNARINHWLKVEPVREIRGSREQPADAPIRHVARLPQTAAAPHSELELALVSIWEKLLGVSGIGIHDNFFELGGNSLVAVQIISRVRELTKLELPLRVLFETHTIAALADAIEKVMAQPTVKTQRITRAPRDRELPLSFAQQRLWFMEQLEPGSALYNCPGGARLRGPLNVSALEQALNEIVRRHEILRTTYSAIDGRPKQGINPPQPLSLIVEDISGITSAEEREAEARRLINAAARSPFDLAHGPMLRAGLLRLAADEHIIHLTMHHIVADAWSMAILMKEVGLLYTAFSQGEASPLSELPVQYADYAYWQQNWLQGEVLRSELDYWKKQLGGTLPALELPLDRPRPMRPTYQGARLSFVLTPELSDAVKTFSRKENVTLFIALLAAFKTLLYRYTKMEEVVVGTANANRNHPETEALIGFFINMLVLRTEFSGDQSFKQLLRRVREVTLEAYAHQEVPFEKIVEELKVERQGTHTPLFQVAFGVENAFQTAFGAVASTAAEQHADAALTMQPIPFEVDAARYELTLWVRDNKGHLSGWWNYNTSLFDESTIARLQRHFETLLQSIVENPETRLDALDMLSQEERREQATRHKTQEAAKHKRLLNIKPQAIRVSQGGS
jgi:acyl transferase domain-containing protein/acyl carrier protein